MTTTSETQKPLPLAGVQEWERGRDPWHSDAFKGTPVEGHFQTTGPRASGWLGLDWCGNPIAWVADGTRQE